jgi:transcriptional regulator with XRE-family HTH domain
MRRLAMRPESFGFSGRRRTPGLRREEVAQRANISVTWYTWLEQGRGGAPSPTVLDRVASALALDEHARAHLFQIGLGHPPAPKGAPSDEVPGRIAHLLAAFDGIPAYVKNLRWDLLAWNSAAAAVFGYGSGPAFERNLLRRIFLSEPVRAAQPDWPAVARFVVGAFRADAARAAGTAMGEGVDALVDELCAASTAFATLWRSQEVVPFGQGDKTLLLPGGRALRLEYSALIVDGRPDLSLVLYNPATTADTAVLREMIAAEAVAHPP